MDTLQVGDWVQSDTGAAGTVMVMSDNGLRAYIEVGRGTLGAGLVSFPVARLEKTEPPKLAEKTDPPIAATALPPQNTGSMPISHTIPWESPAI